MDWQDAKVSWKVAVSGYIATELYVYGGSVLRLSNLGTAKTGGSMTVSGDRQWLSRMTHADLCLSPQEPTP